MTISLTALGTRAVVLDIEGTTTPIDFVYRELFPYARAHAEAFLRRKPADAGLAEVLALLEEDRLAEVRRGEMPPVAVLDFVYWLMDRDRKARGLKHLQGLIWEQGYRDGSLHGQVYADVRPALERWTRLGFCVHIYSSGSVLAQRLIFGSTAYGDLTPFVQRYFDTETGAKTDAASYTRIIESVGVAASHALFVSDAVAELDAASAAGLRTALCVRDADGPVPATTHPIVRTFDEIEATTLSPAVPRPPSR